MKQEGKAVGRAMRVAGWILCGVVALASVVGGQPADELPITVAVPADQLDDVEVVAGGEKLDFRALPPADWQVVLYFDQLLSDPLALANAAILLSERAEELIALGPVEVLLGGESVRASLPPTTEPAVLAEALSWLRLRESSADAQTAVRREFVEQLDSRLSEAEIAAALEESLRIEREVLRVQREGLLLWATAERRAGPRLLLLAGSGHDAAAGEFYRVALERAGRTSVTVPEFVVEPTLAEVGQALAMTGWTVLPFAPAAGSDALLAGSLPQKPPETVTTPDGREVPRTVIGTDVLGLLRRGADDEEAEPDETAWQLDPTSGLAPLAEATGGSVVRDPLILDRRLTELEWRSVLAVRLPELGEALPIEVRAQGLERAVAAPAWIGAGAPAALGAARARYLAASGETLDGELQVAALVAAGTPPQLAIELASAGGGTPVSAPVRLTVAVARDGGTEIVDQRTVEAADLGSGRITLDLPAEAGIDPATTPVLVVLDELATDRWGGTFAGFTSAVESHRAADGSMLVDLPSAAPVRLLAPQDALLVGRTPFAVAVADPRTAEVEFLLDGRREAVRRAAPYEASLDLGELPRARRVEVVARDAEGTEIGRDALRINSGNRELAIALNAPEATKSPNGGVRAQGELWVEATIDRPLAARIARVEFLWVDRPIGTLFAPPFRQRVPLEPGARGFVRAIVTLVDGSSAEDVLFVNSAATGERLQVTLVEVLAVVTGADGRPVADLPKEAFEVREDGEEQPIAVFTSAGSIPLTVGLSVDTSASMFVKLPTVQLAAMDFLEQLLSERDRGFVVGFGREPDLLAATTGDVPKLLRGVEAMRPEGFTSIWKGIVYSLVQLQGTPGKKALVVYSDGADEDPDFSYRVARRFARVVGVPIYVILSNNEIVRTEGRGLNVRGFLRRLQELVDDVGGRVYFTRVGEDLGDVYAEIAEELRSQYVLGYYGEQDAEGDWRKIAVEVSEPGLRVRAARGRYP